MTEIYFQGMIGMRGIPGFAGPAGPKVSDTQLYIKYSKGATLIQITHLF